MHKMANMRDRVVKRLFNDDFCIQDTVYRDAIHDLTLISAIEINFIFY